MAIDTIQITADAVLVSLTPTANQAACSLCQHVSRQIHSSYTRTVADLPWAALPVQFHLTLRRFFCRNRACPRKIFAERLPALVAPYARRTARLAQTLQDLVLQVGGQTGARLAQTQGMPVSARTLLRLAQAAPRPPVRATQVIGVDDWAWRKGHTYGTLIVDLQHHQPLDLLPDRTAETLAAWLAAHPEVQIISRDRAGAYAEGATQGRPDATQVADRFHLVKNLVEALEKLFLRKRALLKSAANPAAVTPADTPAAPHAAAEALRIMAERESIQPSAQAEAASRARHEKYIELHQRIHALASKQVDGANIARQTGVSRRTVYRYLAMSEPPERRQLYRPRSHRLDPYKPYILARWNEGCRSARQIWRELRTQGYPESDTTVSRFVAQLRKDSGQPRSFKTVAPTAIYSAGAESRRPLTALQVSRVLVTRTERRLPWQSAYLPRLVAADPEVQQTQELVDGFMAMVRERRGTELEGWLHAVAASEIGELQSCGKGLRQDCAAVKAGLTLAWSNGPTEAQVGRLKMLKRTMNGRASLPLLRARVLYQPPALQQLRRKQPPALAQVA